MSDAEKKEEVKGAEAFFEGEGKEDSEDEGDQIQKNKEAEEGAEKDTEKDGTYVPVQEKDQHEADEEDKKACKDEDDKEKHEGSDAEDKDEDHDSEEDETAKDEVEKDELFVEESEDEEEEEEEQGTANKQLTTIAVDPILEDTMSRKDALPKPQATPKTRWSQRLISQAGGKQMIAAEISKSKSKRDASCIEGRESSDRPDASQKGHKQQRCDVEQAFDPSCNLLTPIKQTGRKRQAHDSAPQNVERSPTKHKTEQGQRQQQQKSTFPDTNSERRKALSVLKVSSLKNMALESGATAEEVESAMESDHLQDALVILVLTHEAEDESHKRVEELGNLKDGALRKMALERNFGEHRMKQAETNDDFKGCLINCILEADALKAKAEVPVQTRLQELSGLKIMIFSQLSRHRGTNPHKAKNA